jgi:hypothetical protein
VLEREKVLPDVAAWVRGKATPAHQIATMRLNRWNSAYRYYVERHTLMLETDQEVQALLSSPAPFYCVMMKRDFDELAGRGIALDIVYRREGLRVTSGRALWRRNRDTAEFVVTTRPGTLSPAAASQEQPVSAIARDAVR